MENDVKMNIILHYISNRAIWFKHISCNFLPIWQEVGSCKMQFNLF